MKKLSEAVRDGASKTGWLKGGFARKSRGNGNGNENDIDACALAAAYADITGDMKGASAGGKVLELIGNTYPLVKDPDCFAHRAEEEKMSQRLTEKYDIEFPKELLRVTRQVEDESKPELKACRCKTKQDIMTEVMARNDRGETRESIADWLESIGL